MVGNYMPATRQLSQQMIDQLLQRAASMRQGGPFQPGMGPVSANMMPPGPAALQGGGLPPQAMPQGLPPQAMAPQMNPMMGGVPGGGMGQGPGAGFDPERIKAYADFMQMMRNQQQSPEGLRHVGGAGSAPANFTQPNMIQRLLASMGGGGGGQMPPVPPGMAARPPQGAMPGQTAMPKAMPGM